MTVGHNGDALPSSPLTELDRQLAMNFLLADTDR